MKRKHFDPSKYLSNPLMIAYLAFLFISMIAQCVCSAYKYDFDGWSGIVVGATVASYFFSFSMYYKNKCEMDLKQISSYEDYLNQISIVRNSMFFLFKENSMNTAIDIFYNKVKELNNGIKDLLKKYSKHRIIYHIIASLGFLAFFVVAFLKPVSDRVSNSQEMLTVMAFLLMLATEEINSKERRIDDDLKEQSKLPLEEIMEILSNNNYSIVKSKDKEDKNGQAEDEKQG